MRNHRAAEIARKQQRPEGRRFGDREQQRTHQFEDSDGYTKFKQVQFLEVLQHSLGTGKFEAGAGDKRKGYQACENVRSDIDVRAELQRSLADSPETEWASLLARLPKPKTKAATAEAVTTSTAASGQPVTRDEFPPLRACA